jgi:uncharacterized PurR-regulated membrane protein YhhQ (DUF165 family)
VPTLHDQVLSQTWQYQGQIQKMLDVAYLIIVASLPGLVVSQTWQYQGKIQKMLEPMVFSY